MYLGLLPWEAKARRHIAWTYQIHANEFQSLSIVYGYQHKAGKLEKGCSIQICTDWSGARGAWQRMVITGINKCVEKGFIDRVRSGKGFKLLITEKGMQVLQAWSNRLDEILPDCSKQSI
jgi:hypothetical protein